MRAPHTFLLFTSISCNLKGCTLKIKAQTGKRGGDECFGNRGGNGGEVHACTVYTDASEEGEMGEEEEWGKWINRVLVVTAWRREEGRGGPLPPPSTQPQSDVA